MNGKIKQYGLQLKSRIKTKPNTIIEKKHNVITLLH